MLFVGYGIGGCDCGPEERGAFCWLCDHQWVYAAFATSPLWITVAMHVRSKGRQQRRDLYGEKDSE
jgi:hypothetical protein